MDRLSRRAFVGNGTLFLAATGLFQPKMVNASGQNSVVRAGLMTDLHYADKPSAGTRNYRETLRKLTEAATRFEKAQTDFIVEIGDLIDAADSVEVERQYLDTVNREFSAISKDRHYVLGNHCVDTLYKAEFLEAVEQEKSYYSFDRGDVHFVVLDACFRSDGEPYGRKNSKWNDANIPGDELEWLQSDLKSADKMTVVFVHQRLDVCNDHGVKNCHEIRSILEDSARVVSVFQGHSHQNDHQEIHGIHYCTLAAMVEGSGAENNGYSILDIHQDGSMQLHGFRRQLNYHWKP